ncbi:hypothetical protein LZ198_12485 [Myxococcus sp. K15C18031901]|uniref:hypothetical protein n=1 Tax=Myxococcus dinghuensis TaxID=2906761 RepID=UPI0020A760B3|nr:hypothetical protein [Myxococcus dinghuensis]MCP3099685.1 hypothetical protein [Myxococcus dinghuensis]
MDLDIRARFLDGAVRAWSTDARLLGVARADGHRPTYIDGTRELVLVLVCRDEALAGVLAERLDLAKAAGPLLQAFSEDSRRLTCLYDRPLIHVELDFATLTELGHLEGKTSVVWEHSGALTARLERPMSGPDDAPPPHWFEGRFWVWVHQAACMAQQRRVFDCITLLGTLREQVLVPMLRAVVRAPPRTLLSELGTRLPPDGPQFEDTVARPVPEDCGRALHATVGIYDLLRTGAGITHASPAEPAVRNHLARHFPQARRDRRAR